MKALGCQAASAKETIVSFSFFLFPPSVLPLLSLSGAGLAVTVPSISGLIATAAQLLVVSAVESE